MNKNQTETFAAGEIPEEFKAREFNESGQPDDGEAFLEAAEPHFSLEERTLSESARWRVAKALLKLRDQVNATFPTRNKGSDGFIGDEAHCPGTSDHCPLINDGGVGVVAAFDMTHDPDSGCNAEKIVAAIITSRDPRIKYIIWNRHIWNSSAIGNHAPWAKRPYNGSNPHSRHAHFSVSKNPTKYDNTAEWVITQADV